MAIWRVSSDCDKIDCERARQPLAQGLEAEGSLTWMIVQLTMKEAVEESIRPKPYWKDIQFSGINKVCIYCIVKEGMGFCTIKFNTKI